MTTSVINETSNVSGFDSVFGTSRGIAASNLSERELLIGGYTALYERSELIEALSQEISKGKYARLLLAINAPDDDHSYPEDVRTLVQDVVRHRDAPLFGTIEDIVNTLWSLATGDSVQAGRSELLHGMRETLILDDTHMTLKLLKEGKYANYKNKGKLTLRKYDLPELKKTRLAPTAGSTTSVYSMFCERASRVLEANNATVTSHLNLLVNVPEDAWGAFAQHFWQKYINFHSAKPGTPVQPLDRSWMLNTAKNLF